MKPLPEAEFGQSAMCEDPSVTEEFGEAGRAPVIAHKVRPPRLSARVVPRPRVQHRLRELLDAADVVVVAATAGAGKTTAVLEALEARDTSVAWLTVDSPDTEPGRLIAYLEAALREQVPAVGWRASDAIAVGLSHPEAAGLLADSLSGIDRELVLVLDDLERIGVQPEAWSVIAAFLRHSPDGVKTVLVSRRSPPAPAALPAPPSLQLLDERHLCFTPEEAASVLVGNGRGDLDPKVAVDATGGWVTGVLFESWRASDHLAGAGGEADPLFGYLGFHIVSQLPDQTQVFLIESSLLPEVDRDAATAIGLSAAGRHLATLRSAHLPVAWDNERQAMRCHPRFREYLSARLEASSRTERMRELRAAYGRLLAAQGHHEDAAEEFLRAEDRSRAKAAATAAILSVIERFDLAQARRWLSLLGGGGARPTNFAIAELTLCWAEEDYRGVVRVADELAERGEREPLARRSSKAAALMAWCYYMRGRRTDADAIFAIASGKEVDGVAYFVAQSYERPTRPDLGGGPFDLFTLFADYFAGRFSAVSPAAESRWAASVIHTWGIAVMMSTGHTAEARRAYEDAIAADECPLAMLTYIGPEIYIDACDTEAAWRAIEQARNRFDEIGALAFNQSICLTEAKLALRLERDATKAKRILDRLDAETFVEGWLFRTTVDVWYGLAELIAGEDEAALRRLRQTVATMESSDGHLQQPAAAIYLAEAEWRAGDEAGADLAADLALAAAKSQGSNHLILKALADFPSVASRRLAAEAGLDTPWHEIGRALMAQGESVVAPADCSMLVEEFGTSAIRYEGNHLRPQLRRSLELMAFLTSRPDGTASRGEIITALFEGRVDNSTRVYLRQILHQLRTVLPDDTLIADSESIGLSGRVPVEGESARLVRSLGEAARLQGADRLAATQAALALTEKGEYLAGYDSEWVTLRRKELEEICEEARLEAANLALATGDFAVSRALCRRVIVTNPFRESAWRTLMKVATAVGEDDAAVQAYRGCKLALAEIGTEPTPGTRALLAR